MHIFTNQFTLTNFKGSVVIDADQISKNISKNQLSFSFPDGHREPLYWSLPLQFVGNQVLSYGGSLRFSVLNSIFSGQYVPDRDVILTGNDITLIWTRKDAKEEVHCVHDYFFVK